MIINFQEPLNVSVQVGDIAWYLPITSNVGVPGNTYNTANMDNAMEIGVIDQVTTYTISVTNVVNSPLQGFFIMFSKNDEVNKGDLLGYYAKIKMVNSRTDKIELFAVSSETIQSSK